MNVENVGRAVLIGLILISLSYPIVFVFGVSKITLTILFYLLPLSSLGGYLFTRPSFPKKECEIVLRDGRRIKGKLVSIDENFVQILNNKLRIFQTRDVVEIIFNTSTEKIEHSEGLSPQTPF